MLNILGRGRRIRLSGISASLIQILAGAVYVSKFFKDEPTWVLISTIVVILLFIILSVIIEPSDKDKRGG